MERGFINLQRAMSFMYEVGCIRILSACYMYYTTINPEWGGGGATYSCLVPRLIC